MGAVGIRLGSRRAPLARLPGGVLLAVLLQAAAADAAPVDPAADQFGPVPQLRPCCALGYDLRTRVGASDVLVTLTNVVDPTRLGRHSYLKRDLPTEVNGLVYTCRGGVVDLAHVRDNADRTAYLYARIRQARGSSAVVPLDREGGERQLRLGAFPAGLDERARDALALRLAQRVAFELSVWHEVTTWWGFETVRGFSEKVSAFSPEDLFSNALGIHLGAAALARGGDYDEAVDLELRAALQRVGARPLAHTRQALDAVEGVWWTRTRVLPDYRMVMRRNLDVGPTVAPWLVPAAYFDACGRESPAPARLEVPQEGPGGVRLRDLYEIRLVVDRGEMPAFPLPDPQRAWVGSRDLPVLVARTRDEIRREFGPAGDQPGLELRVPGAAGPGRKRFDPSRPCGSHDPTCAAARAAEVHGVKLGKLWVGGGNYPGPFLGGTLAEVTGVGGGFSVLAVSALLDASSRDYTLHLKAVATRDVLLFCRVAAEDGSGRTHLDFPFVNPVSPRCVGRSTFGVRLNLWESYYRSDSGKSAIRPVDLGLVWNVLRNGHTTGFLHRHLLVDLSVAPETIKVAGREYDLVSGRIGVKWGRMFAADRVGLSVFGQFRDDLRAPRDFAAEGGLRLAYNHLWTRRDRRNDRAIHSILRIVLEAGVTYWRNPDKSMPGMATVLVPPNANVIPTGRTLSTQVALFLETTIPKLGLF